MANRRLSKANVGSGMDSQRPHTSAFHPTPTNQQPTTTHFTLVELLVVIGIIAILAAMLMPAISAARDHARKGAIQTEIHSMEIAMEAYRQDWGLYPPDRTQAGDYAAPDGTSLGAMTSPECLVYFLGNEFRVNDDSEQVFATKNGGSYYNFKPDRLTRDTTGNGSPDTEWDVYMDHFGRREGVFYFRFDNNDDDDGSESWDENYNGAFNGWNVSNVHPSKIDIWAADGDGQDFLSEGMNATRTNIEDIKNHKTADTIGNW